MVEKARLVLLRVFREEKRKKERKKEHESGGGRRKRKKGSGTKGKRKTGK